jgi:hypothetical protein
LRCGCDPKTARSSKTGVEPGVGQAGMLTDGGRERCETMAEKSGNWFERKKERAGMGGGSGLFKKK